MPNPLKLISFPRAAPPALVPPVHGRPAGTVPVAPSLPRDVAARALDVVAEGVVVHDVSGRLARANPAAAAILGLGRAPDGRDREVPVGPDGAGVHDAEHPTARALRTGSPCGRLLGLRGADGTRWLRVTASPIADARGRPVGVVTTYVDVTGELAAPIPVDGVSYDPRGDDGRRRPEAHAA